MDANEAAGEETRRKLHKNVESSIKQVLATTPHETPTIRTLAPHHENYTSQTNQTRGTLLEKQGRAHKRCTPVDPHIWMCKSRTTSTNLHTATMWGHRIVTLKTCRRRWMIGRNGERGSGYPRWRRDMMMMMTAQLQWILALNMYSIILVDWLWDLWHIIPYAYFDTNSFFIYELKANFNFIFKRVVRARLFAHR